MADKRTIWKFPIPVEDAQATHTMPGKANVVAVGMDPMEPARHVVAVWADVVPGMFGEVERTFLVTGTGHPVPRYATYLGTALEPGFAWHVWETADPA